MIRVFRVDGRREFADPFDFFIVVFIQLVGKDDENLVVQKLETTDSLDHLPESLQIEKKS